MPDVPPVMPQSSGVRTTRRDGVTLLVADDVAAWLLDLAENVTAGDPDCEYGRFAAAYLRVAVQQMLVAYGAPQ